MKRMFLLAVTTLLLCSTAYAELHLYDSQNRDLGVLIGIDSFYLSHNTKYDLYDPTKGYTYEIQVYADDRFEVPGDINSTDEMYFTGSSCTGDKYVEAYGGLVGAIVKFGTNYYKVIGAGKKIVFASRREFDEETGKYHCSNYPDSGNFVTSKVRSISKPYSFLPAKPPFTIKAR